MPKETEYVDYELWLGTFDKNGDYNWKVVDKFDIFKEAYASYKKIILKSMGYTDQELKKEYGSGRLDVELRHGNKLLNWAGIYSRLADKGEDPEEEEKKERLKKADE